MNEVEVLNDDGCSGRTRRDRCHDRLRANARDDRRGDALGAHLRTTDARRRGTRLDGDGDASFSARARLGSACECSAKKQQAQ